MSGVHAASLTEQYEPSLVTAVEIVAWISVVIWVAIAFGGPAFHTLYEAIGALLVGMT